MTNQKHFNFLKEGNDPEFDSAMKNIDVMYDNLFSDDKLDKIFETFKVDNNPIIEPIDEMAKEIFDTDSTPKGPKYVKVDQCSNEVDDDEFVIGEPLYEDNDVVQGYPETLGENPYAYNQSTSQEGYFGNWKGASGGQKYY